MLRAQALGRVALGWSGMHMNRPFKPTNLRPTALLLGARLSPNRVDFWRSCSILGSPACGGHSNPGQSLFQDVLEAFPNNRCRIITKFGLYWDVWSLQVLGLCLWLRRFPAARAANERQHDRLHILRWGVSLLGEFKLRWLLLHNLVEQDSEKWHEENLARHPSHYASFARSLPKLDIFGRRRTDMSQVFGPQENHSNPEVLWGQTILQHTCSLGRGENKVWRDWQVC